MGGGGAGGLSDSEKVAYGNASLLQKSRYMYVFTATTGLISLLVDNMSPGISPAQLVSVPLLMLTL